MQALYINKDRLVLVRASLYKLERSDMREKIQKLLDMHCMSWYKLAKELGLPESTVNSWKQGVRTPTLDNLVKVCNYFGITVDELIDL